MFMNDKQNISIVEVISINNKSAFHLFVSDKKDSEKDKYIGQVESAEFARLFASSYNMYRFMKLLRDSAEYDEKTSGVFKMGCKILDEIEGKNQEVQE